MIYPRVTTINGKEHLVNEREMVGYKEHMSQEHRFLFLSGVLSSDTDPMNLLLAFDTLSIDPIKLVITSPGGDLDSTFLF